MIIGQGEVRMDEKKLDAIKEWKPPPPSRESGCSLDLRIFIENSFLISPTS